MNRPHEWDSVSLWKQDEKAAASMALFQNKHEENVIQEAPRLLSVIWLMLKALFRYGNKKLVTSSYQRYEIFGREFYYDDKKNVIYFPGT
tara:strand:- start:333 stop:602 length:270 start_codon:yes stop_codon:yes gene_type:complete